MSSQDPAKTIADQLVKGGRQRREAFDFVLQKYANERLLYRLSISNYAKSYILKGGTLFATWMSNPYRPTKDIDFLGTGPNDVDSIKAVFSDVISLAGEDGLVFDLSTLKVEAINEDGLYSGVRVTVHCSLIKSRTKIQVDIGFGDALTTEADLITLPTLLDMPAPQLLCYTQEASIAEKFQAMVALEMRNSRMKDFYDINEAAANFQFNGPELMKQIAATFERRQTQLPMVPPLALTDQFLLNAEKIKMWQGFVSKNKLDQGITLQKCGITIAALIMPPVLAGASNQIFGQTWSPGGPWT